MRERSSAGAECVSAPIDSHSTPVSASSRSVCRVTPPLASSVARPSTCATAARSPASSMLSSSSRGAPAASASSISRASRTSTSSVSASCGACVARACDRRRDASRGGDVVLLDQDRVVEPRAVVDRAAGRHRRLLERAQAGRRLARVEHARPRALHRGARRAPPASRCPTGARGSSARCAHRSAAPARALDRQHRPRPRASAPPARERSSCASPSSSAKTSSAACSPKITPGAFCLIDARARASSATVASVVTSPLPTSSSSARATSAASSRSLLDHGLPAPASRNARTKPSRSPSSTR